MDLKHRQVALRVLGLKETIALEFGGVWYDTGWTRGALWSVRDWLFCFQGTNDARRFRKSRAAATPFFFFFSPLSDLRQLSSLTVLGTLTSLIESAISEAFLFIKKSHFELSHFTWTKNEISLFFRDSTLRKVLEVVIKETAKHSWGNSNSFIEIKALRKYSGTFFPPLKVSLVWALWLDFTSAFSCMTNVHGACCCLTGLPGR